MTHAYKHSESFAKLKSLKESIDTNLTSYQYLSVLDEMLYNAVQPLIENTRFVDVFMAQMLGWQTINPKRKTCGLGRHAFSASTTLFLLSDSPKQKLKILKKMRLDRAMLFELLRRWFELAAPLQEIGDKTSSKAALSDLHALQEKCLVKQGHGLTSTYRLSNYWFKESLEYKRKILEKYTRNCLMIAKRDYEELQHQIPLDDIVQVYLLTASKAIDKCDSDRGVLTTHIQNWLLSAKNVVVAMYLTGGGEDAKRINISTTTSKKIVDELMESSDLEDIDELSHSDDELRERESDLREIRLVAKLFDPTGIGRLLLGIQEELSVDDQLKLRALAVTSVNQKSVSVNTLE